MSVRDFTQKIIIYMVLLLLTIAQGSSFTVCLHWPELRCPNIPVPIATLGKIQQLVSPSLTFRGKSLVIQLWGYSVCVQIHQNILKTITDKQTRFLIELVVKWRMIFYDKWTHLMKRGQRCLNRWAQSCHKQA